MKDWSVTRSELQDRAHRLVRERKNERARWKRKRDVLLKILNGELRNVVRVTPILRQLEREGYILIEEPLFRRTAPKLRHPYHIRFVTFAPHYKATYVGPRPRRALEL